MRDLNRGQRVAVLIGLAAALFAFGSWVTARHTVAFGWFAYSPLHPTPASGTNFPLWAMLLWLGLAVVWTVCALLLLRDQRYPAPGATSPTADAPSENAATGGFERLQR